MAFEAEAKENSEMVYYKQSISEVVLITSTLQGNY